MNLLSWFVNEPLSPGSQIVEVSMKLRPWLPMELLLLLCVAGLILNYIVMLRDARSRPLWQRTVLIALRSLALLLVAGVMAAPLVIVAIEKSTPPTAAVLLDASRSMDLSDDAGGSIERRWTLAVKATQDAILPALEKQSVPRLIPFSAASAVREVTSAALSAVSPDGQQTDLGASLSAASRMLRTTPLRRIVLISDGQDTSGGNPLEEVERLAGQGIVVDAFLIGGKKQRNVRLEPVLADPYAFKGDQVQYNIRATATGYDSQVAPVILTIDGQEIDRADLTFNPDTGEASAVLRYTPEIAGTLTLHFEVPLQPEETVGEDNAQEVSIEVLAEKMRILVIEEQPRWEYRFLETALQRDPRMEPSFLLAVADHGGAPVPPHIDIFPETREELYEYDLILIGDISRALLSPEAQQLLREYVIDDAGAILFLAGRRFLFPFEGSALDTLMPVRIDRLRAGDAPLAQPLTQSATLRVSPLGSRHPILAGFQSSGAWSDPFADLPGMYWHAPIREARAGALVLAEHPYDHNDKGPDPLLVFQYVGRGRTLFVGFEETWRWRFRVGNREYYRFWGNAIQYMAMPHLLGKKDRVQFEAPNTATVGEPADVGVRIVDEQGNPVEADGQRLIISDEAGQPQSVNLFPVPDQKGFYRGQAAFQSGGRHTLRIADYEEEGEASVLVIESSAELRDPNPNETVMQRIAAVGKGVYAPYADWSAALEKIKIDPITTRRVVEHTLWDRPIILFLLAALLATEWVLRRLWRLL